MIQTIVAERVKIAFAKIQIAMGYDVNCGDIQFNPNTEHAKKILSDLQAELGADGETPLELLGLPPAIVGYLQSGGIDTIQQLQRLSDAELGKIPQIRGGRIEVIDKRLQEAGLPRIKAEPTS